MLSIVIQGIHFLIGQLLDSNDYVRLEDGTIPGMIEPAENNRTEGGLNYTGEIAGGIIGIIGGVLTYIILGFTGVTYEVLISIVFDQAASFYPRLYVAAALGLVTTLYLQELVVEALTWEQLEF